MRYELLAMKVDHGQMCDFRMTLLSHEPSMEMHKIKAKTRNERISLGDVPTLSWMHRM